MSISIDDEFRALIPPLSADERAQLEANILADGCRDPLVVWGGVLIDGHNRYEICTKHGLPFDTAEQEFEGRDQAIEWIIKNQFGRRNLSDYQRGVLALRLKPIMEARAEAKRLETQGRPEKLSQISDAVIPPAVGKFRADEAVSEMANVSRDTIRKIERIEEVARPEVKALASAGEVSINLASQFVELPEDAQEEVMDSISGGKEPAKEAMREAIKHYRAINTGENEWYTPAEYAEMARSVMGGIDLDPASCEEANRVIKASTYFTKDDDGLVKEWVGNVWCNPPYSRDLMPAFVEKLCKSYQSGSVRQAILVSHNNTDTAWFHSLAGVASAICFPKKRIKFYRGEDIAAPTNGQAFFYLGDRIEGFRDTFSSVGFVVAPL